MAIAEILADYSGDDRTDVWESIQAYAECYARESIEAITATSDPSVPDGYALVEIGILSDRCLAVAMRDAAIVSKATNGDSTAVATATINAYLIAASGKGGDK